MHHHLNRHYHQDDALTIRRTHYAVGKDNMSMHTHEYMTISVLLSGSLAERTPEGMAMALPGTVFIKPAGLPHAISLSEDSALLSFSIFDWKHFNLDFEDWAVLPQLPATRHFLRLLQQEDKQDAFHALGHALTQQQDRQREAAPPPDWLEAVRNIVEEHYHETISIHDLAREVGRHPGTVGRAFKRYFHTDLKTYQQQIRIHQAMAQITLGHKNLTEIAHHQGYADQPHFSRAFKRATDVSPRVAVQLLGG